MAVGGGRPVFEIDPKALMAGGDETEFGKWDGVVEYEFTTLMKPTGDNLAEYNQRYNLICKELEKVEKRDAIAELIELRHAMRRAALNDEPLILEASPYTDAGAALLYGYVEGAAEKAKEDYEAKMNFGKKFKVGKNKDGETMIWPVSAAGLSDGD